MKPNAATAAAYAGYAEAMADDSLAPPLPAAMAADWTIVGYVIAQDALFGVQSLGLGEWVYFGFLAQSKTDATQFIYVIRGTRPTSFIEWAEDGLALLVNHVHAGFKSIHDTMQIAGRSSADMVAQIVGAGSVVCIGHSLGGPLAGYELELLRGHGIAATGMFFACPKPGDDRFAALFDAIVGTDNYRVFDYSRDRVPNLPLTLWPDFMFAHLHQRTVILPSQSTAIIPDNVFENHHAENYALLLAGMKP